MNANTIYQYYEKLSERFFLAKIEDKKKVKYLWQLSAQKLTIHGYQDFDFFIFKDGIYSVVCEGLTGIMVLHQQSLPTRPMRRLRMSEFIKYLPDHIKQQGGTAMLNKNIIDFLVDHNRVISPRYKAKENGK
jgi:hypothetical protein